MCLGIIWANHSLISLSWWKYNQRNYLVFKNLEKLNFWWHILFFNCLLPLTLLLLVCGFVSFTWLYHLILQHTRIYWGYHNGQWALLAVSPFGNRHSKLLWGQGNILLWQSDIKPPCIEWWTQAETMRAQSKTLLELLAMGGSPWGSYIGRCEPGAAQDYYMQKLRLEMRQTEPRRLWGEKRKWEGCYIWAGESTWA